MWWEKVVCRATKEKILAYDIASEGWLVLKIHAQWLLKSDFGTIPPINSSFVVLDLNMLFGLYVYLFKICYSVYMPCFGDILIETCIDQNAVGNLESLLWQGSRMVGTRLQVMWVPGNLQFFTFVKILINQSTDNGQVEAFHFN